MLSFNTQYLSHAHTFFQFRCTEHTFLQNSIYISKSKMGYEIHEMRAIFSFPFYSGKLNFTYVHIWLQYLFRLTFFYSHYFYFLCSAHIYSKCRTIFIITYSDLTYFQSISFTLNETFIWHVLSHSFGKRKRKKQNNNHNFI